MNSLILSDMFVEWRRRLGGERFWLRCEMWQGKLSTCYPGLT